MSGSNRDRLESKTDSAASAEHPRAPADDSPETRVSGPVNALRYESFAPPHPAVSDVAPRGTHADAGEGCFGLDADPALQQWLDGARAKTQSAVSRAPRSLPPPSSRTPIALDQRVLTLMHECFAGHAGPDSRIDVSELQRSIEIQDEFLAERVLAVFDKNRDGWVSRVEFVQGVPRLLFGSLLDKLRFAFRVHDLDGNGAINRDELQRMIRLGLSENGMRADTAAVQRFTQVLLQAADTDGDGRISFSEFERLALHHPDVTNLIARSEARWVSPQQELEVSPKPRSALQRGMRFLDNHVSPVVVIGVWALGNVWFILDAVLRYQASGANLWIQVARGAGAGINLNAALILLPMARRLLTWVRRTPGLRALPVDDAVSFHRRLGDVLAVLSVAHGAAHLGNYLSGNNGGLASLGTTVAGATGVVLLSVFALMWVYSRPSVRGSGRFELFHRTHLLYPIWLVLALVHAPALKLWLALPLLGYALDRWLRRAQSAQETSVTKAEVLPSGVTKLTLARPYGFAHSAGDYLFLKLPRLAEHEWHPFTISSAPERKELTLHVRSLGDFTGALHRLAATNPGPLEAYVDGPFGTASGHIFESRRAVLIGAGIGVTPFASVLESIVLRNAAGSGALEKVYFYWLNRDATSFEWFAALLSELERKDGQGLVDIRIFMTQARGNIHAALLNLAWNLAHARGDRDLVTGLRAKTQPGAPDWRTELAEIAKTHRGESVDVFFCGPPGLGRVVKRYCAEFGMRFRQEHF